MESSIVSTHISNVVMIFCINLLLVGCQTNNNENYSKPNIVLIVMDSTRPDRLSSYGYSKNTTPHIDRLAKQGVIFTNAHSTHIESITAHFSLFTGAVLPPRGKELRNYFENNQAEIKRISEETITKRLIKNGYYTIGVSANFLISPKTMDAFDGFDLWGEDALNKLDTAEQRAEILTLYQAKNTKFNNYHIGVNANNVNLIVFNLLEKYKRETKTKEGLPPFFLFINYLDPHDPYFPMPPFDKYFQANIQSNFNGDVRSGRPHFKKAHDLTKADLNKSSLLYDREIAQMDFHIGQLLTKLKELKLDKNLMIYLVADHGELFGEGGGLTHNVPEVREDIQKKIPFIFYNSRMKFKTAKIEEDVYINDIFPTIFDFLNIPPSKHSNGRSLKPILISKSVNLSKKQSQYNFINPSITTNKETDKNEELLKRMKMLGYTQ